MILSWQLLSQVFTVETIMTVRSQLLTWDGVAPLDSLWEQAAQLKVDTLPIVKDQQIIGFMRRGKDAPEPLIPEWLISRDTAIPDLVSIFAQKSQSSLFVFYRQEIVGIVTPADLNKLPARTYFYNLLAELEMTIAEIVRRQYGPKQDAILTLLDRQGEIDTINSQLAASDLTIDIVHTLNLSDLVNLARKDSVFRASLGFSSNKKLEKNMNGLVHLRNDIMHPVRLILDDYTGIEKLNERIQRALEILNRLTSSTGRSVVQTIS